MPSHTRILQIPDRRRTFFLESHSTRPESSTGRCPPFVRLHLGLGPVENLEGERR